MGLVSSTVAVQGLPAARLVRREDCLTLALTPTPTLTLTLTLTPTPTLTLTPTPTLTLTRCGERTGAGASAVATWWRAAWRTRRSRGTTRTRCDMYLLNIVTGVLSRGFHPKLAVLTKRCGPRRSVVRVLRPWHDSASAAGAASQHEPPARHQERPAAPEVRVLRRTSALSKASLLSPAQRGGRSKLLGRGGPRLGAACGAVWR